MKQTHFFISLSALGLIAIAGCGSSAPEVSEIGDNATVEIPPNLNPETAPLVPDVTVELEPVPIEDGVVTLDSENAAIWFVGSKPDGTRHFGGFRGFSGTIELNEDNTGITRLSVEIQTDSLWADNDRLEGHLKSPDFFEVETYPTATYEANSFGGRGDETRITGELTLHGETQTVQVPAWIEISEDGLTLNGQTAIDRMDFGIDFQPDQINAEIPLRIVVAANAPDAVELELPTPATFGGPARGSAGGGRRPSPEMMFQRWDEDENGTLADAEIPDRMRERLDQIDRDGDGAVSFEEFRASGGPGGGRGPGPGGPAASDTPDEPEADSESSDSEG